MWIEIAFALNADIGKPFEWFSYFFAFVCEHFSTITERVTLFTSITRME